MRRAVLADIHGNLPALEAVIDDMARRKVDAVVDLGDCVSGPLWPRETADRLRQLGWPTVRGNHDRVVGTGGTPRWRADALAVAELDAARRAALHALPTRLDLDARTVAFHASPEADEAYLLEDVVDGRLVRARPETIAARLAGIEATLILCGHSHLASAVRLPDGRWVVNPGSVGCPAYDDPTAPAHVSEAGSPAARYAIVETGPDGSDPDRLRIDLLSVPYDHGAASRRAAALGSPDWAHCLASGYVGPR